MPDWNLKEPIPPKYIKEIIKLDPAHPVFLIVGMMGEKMVLKAETTKGGSSATDVKLNASILGAIDKSKKAYVMSDEEVDALGAGLESYEVRFSEEIVEELIFWVNQDAATFIKLPYVNNLTNLESAGKKVLPDTKEQDKTGVRNIAAVLNSPGGLEKLGELVAADLFSGNRDRFDPTGGMKWPPGKGGKMLKVLQNVGNVFVSDGSLVALDTWDPNAPNRNMLTPMANPNSWYGLMLNPDQQAQATKLQKFTKDIVADLNRVLGVRKRSKLKVALLGASTQRLKAGSDARVLAGIRQGSDKIKQKLASKNNLAAGVTERAQLLGWA